jgi:hypothetical protein
MLKIMCNLTSILFFPISLLLSCEALQTKKVADENTKFIRSYKTWKAMGKKNQSISSVPEDKDA